MANKPSIPKGTRDFGPDEMAKRNYIFDTIKSVYALYGFQQIETPAMETLQTLMGKYGEEGDKLLFKILNSGDFLKSTTDEELLARNPLKLQCTAKSCKCLSNSIRYNPFGVPTNHKRGVIVNFINAMPTLLVQILCSTKWS